MPVSGLLISLRPDPAARRSAIDRLAAHPSVESGERQGHKLPIVVDTPTRDADRRVWNWINDLEGVAFVDVIFVHFDDDEPGADACAAAVSSDQRAVEVER